MPLQRCPINNQTDGERARTDVVIDNSRWKDRIRAENHFEFHKSRSIGYFQQLFCLLCRYLFGSLNISILPLFGCLNSITDGSSSGWRGIITGTIETYRPQKINTQLHLMDFNSKIVATLYSSNHSARNPQSVLSKPFICGCAGVGFPFLMKDIKTE